MGGLTDESTELQDR